MNKEQLLQEIQYKAVRSSGAGGQHVNKVASKVELYFDLPASKGLSEFEKERLQEKMRSRITSAGILILQCDTSRSQHKNKDLVTERFLTLVQEGIKAPKKRKKTRVPKVVKQLRLKNKKMRAEKKTNRRDPLRE